MIPNVAIHMNRQVNDGYTYNPATDMFPLWSTIDGKGTFMTRIAKAAGVEEKDILGHDLFLYNRMPGRIWGDREEFLSIARLDDLECVFSSVKAFVTAEKGCMPMYAPSSITRNPAAAPSRAQIPRS